MHSKNNKGKLVSADCELYSVINKILYTYSQDHKSVQAGKD